MKYYVDYNNGQIKIDVEKEFYQSENLENKITVLLTNVADPEDEVVPAYFLSIEFLRSDGRKCTIQTADAFGEDEDTTLTEDDVTYDIHNFTLTEQVLKCAGTLMFTVYINFVNSDTGKVIRRGVLLNGVNNVKKTVPYSTNSLLVIDDEEEAETTVTDILAELTQINAALATKQQSLSVPIDSGLTMTDSYKLKVKGSESGGISVVPAGVKINYDTDEFQVIKNSANFSGVTYTTKVLKNDYYNNTSPINKKILDENIGAVNYKYKDNLTVTTSAGSYEGRTKYTYTFSGITAKKIKANYSHEWYGTDYSGTGYKYDTNFTPKYNLTFDSSETVCSQFLTLLVKKAIDREYMGNLDIDYRTNITLPSGEIAIFNPVAKVGDIVYFSCPNLVCTMTPTNTTPQILSIVLGLKESGDNYIVEFDVDDVTEHPATISNNTTVHCLTGMVYDAYVSEDDLGVGYKYITLKTSSATSNVKKLIEIDFAPTADSEHLVFSGGVKSALDDVEEDVSALQTQVNNLSSVQNVVDIVATKSALDALTTTNFEEDDKVQVIADETHDGASTVYNWTGSAWEYVGAYGGNSYTKAQTDTLLNGKQNNLTEGNGITISSDTISSYVTISDTYSNIATLKTQNKLIKGYKYRITDYVTKTNGTCNGNSNEAMSAEHPFDIIVTAIDTNKFDEVARAVSHSGDTYFANSNLSAWKLWYCFDNDSTRFEWADTSNGKGVIYRMIDEFGNDLPYDFKNIKFKRFKVTATTDSRQANMIGMYLGFNGNYGVTYDSEDSKFYYTFSKRTDDSDLSLSETCASAIANSYYVKQVKIGEYLTDTPYYRYRQALNNIVIVSSNIIVNIEMGIGSHHNTWIGNSDIDYCYFNQMCRNNIMVGEICHTRANECFENNIIGDGTLSLYASCWNFFDHHFQNNIIINAQSNTFLEQVGNTVFPEQFRRCTVKGMWSFVNMGSHYRIDKCNFSYMHHVTFNGTGTWDSISTTYLYYVNIGINNFFGSVLNRLEYVDISNGTSVINLAIGSIYGFEGKSLQIDLTNFANVGMLCGKKIDFALDTSTSTKRVIYTYTTYNTSDNIKDYGGSIGIVNADTGNVTWSALTTMADNITEQFLTDAQMASLISEVFD